MIAADFLRMFAYDNWANGECLRSLKNLDGSDEKVKRMAHIVSAEKLWLERILRHPQTMAVWPTSTVQDCEALNYEMQKGWNVYIEKLTPTDLKATVEYRNTKGELWSNRVEDILTHVLMHSAYHRGQVALQIRAAGMEPAYTDFIHAVRQGNIETLG